MKPFVLMQPPSSKSTFAIQRRISWKKHEKECQECCSSFLNCECEPLTWRTVVKHKRLSKKQDGDE